jgi:hypothetical protein
MEKMRSVDRSENDGGDRYRFCLEKFTRMYITTMIVLLLFIKCGFVIQEMNEWICFENTASNRLGKMTDEQYILLLLLHS